MSRTLRVFAAVLVFLISRFMADLLLVSFIPGLEPGPAADILSLICAVAAGFFTWKSLASPSSGLITCMALGGMIVGSVGFLGGFFGPIFLAPQANQGPLLGIFITGPIGLLIGTLAGGACWSFRKNKKMT